MLKRLGAVAAGFGIWLVSNVCFSIVSVFVWGHSPDRYFSIAFQCWAATSVAFVFAMSVNERLAPDMSERAYCAILAAVVLPWAASAMLGGIDIDFKLWGLAGHAIAAGVAVRMANPAPRPIVAV